MSLFEIQTTDSKTAFKPGESISGKVIWQLEKQTDALTITLGWQTSGRGSVDKGEEASIEVENPPLYGEREFAFEPPAGPYSYIGRFMQIHWQIEAGANRKDKASIDIVIAPHGKPVDCTERVEDKIGKNRI